MRDIEMCCTLVENVFQGSKICFRLNNVPFRRIRLCVLLKFSE